MNSAANYADPNNDGSPPPVQYTAAALQKLTDFMMTYPGAEIRIVHRPGLQAVAIDGEVVTAGERWATQQHVSDRSIVDSQAPGHALATGLTKVVELLIHHIEKKKEEKGHERRRNDPAGPAAEITDQL